MDREERLAIALEAAQAGPVDWDRVEPDLVDELRGLLAVGQVVNLLGRSTLATLPHGPAASSGAAPLNLPRRFDRFDLLEELGRGGMGVVYKAWDTELKRPVAIKMILRGAHASGEDLARFRQEARAAAGLTHPNIIPVYHVGEADGLAFFCMKYVDGPTLDDLVAAGPLPQQRAAEIVRDIARAVGLAHDRGIVHRDLKPSNVLLDGDQPLVTDFGLAKRTAGDPSITGTGAILGTPSYMAPEQADATGHPGPACDIYSLGAILYELLTGRPPHLASSPVDTLLLVRTEDPVRPRLLNPRIDPDLELICRKCLEKDPAHRYESAARLADDLDAFLQGAAVSARTSSVVYLVTRFFRDTHHAPVLENWGMLWMIHSVATMFLCIVTGVLYYWGIRNHWAYLSMWGIGLVVWGAFFWNLRRRAGPVTFVEREIAHAWAAGVISSIGIFIIEVQLRLDVLTLTPILAICAGMIFLVKAGTLSGGFYIASAASFLAAVPMAWAGPPWSPVIFGLVTGLAFFIPGLKYYRLARQRMAPP